jgi:zinc transporter
MRAFVNQKGVARELPFSEGEALFGSAEFVWLHFDGREAGGQAWLDRQDDIPSIAKSALTASETRPRSDLLAHGAVVNLRAMGKTPEDDPDALVSIRFWAETGRVISLTYRSPFALDSVIETFRSGAISDAGDLLSTFADTISDGLDPDVAELGDAVDECEIAIEKEGIYQMRRKVTHARARAIAYRRFVSPQRQALERLAQSPIEWLDDEDRAHLREAADRAARMVEELESVRERAALMHEELTDLRAEQMDVRALVISVVALVFLPLTFVTGLLGMNVEGIPYASEPWAFWGVAVFCLVIALIVLGWFVRHRWISRN